MTAPPFFPARFENPFTSHVHIQFAREKCTSGGHSAHAVALVPFCIFLPQGELLALAASACLVFKVSRRSTFPARRRWLFLNKELRIFEAAGDLIPLHVHGLDGHAIDLIAFLKVLGQRAGDVEPRILGTSDVHEDTVPRRDEKKR